MVGLEVDWLKTSAASKKSGIDRDGRWGPLLSQPLAVPIFGKTGQVMMLQIWESFGGYAKSIKIKLYCYIP